MRANEKETTQSLKLFPGMAFASYSNQNILKLIHIRSRKNRVKDKDYHHSNLRSKDTISSKGVKWQSERSNKQRTIQ